MELEIVERKLCCKDIGFCFNGLMKQKVKSVTIKIVYDLNNGIVNLSSASREI